MDFWFLFWFLLFLYSMFEISFILPNLKTRLNNLNCNLDLAENPKTNYVLYRFSSESRYDFKNKHRAILIFNLEGNLFSRNMCLYLLQEVYLWNFRKYLARQSENILLPLLLVFSFLVYFCDSLLHTKL
jgi:hypothetical protein